MTSPKSPTKPGTTATTTTAPLSDAWADLPPLPKTIDAPSVAATDAASDTELGDGIPVVTKKVLFTRVKARADGVKGREVRQVMDALLDEIGDALVAGETLKVPMLGTMKVQRHKTLDKADVVVCKLRRKKPGHRAKDPLAEAAEES